ncbi:MAG TPA: protein translocase subunit SecF [bacterium]|nr:protein translocase subunit SecF [bacterium]
MIRLIKDTNINFVSAKKITYFISALLVINGLFALYRIATGSAAMGLDFTGGSAIQVKFEKKVETQQIRDIMTAHNFTQTFIQKIGPDEDNTFLIRIGVGEIKEENVTARLAEMVRADTGDENMMVLEESDVGPVVSVQLKQKALLAVIFASFGILIYIWIRFKFKFAVVATAATIHDVLAVLGILVLMGREIDLLVITALLTVAGFSLNDTVVLFDRIRENMRHILKMPFMDIANKSVNEVLSRTIITGITTLFVAGSLIVFGGNVLQSFSIAIALGVVVGTYSSDLLAAPLLVDWENYEKKHKAIR